MNIGFGTSNKHQNATLLGVVAFLCTPLPMWMQQCWPNNVDSCCVHLDIA